MQETLDQIQQRNIDRAVAAPLHRWLFGDELGCGKSRQALKVAEAIKAQNILVVCPAGVRPNWVRQIERWLPNVGPVGAISYGPRKALSKARKAALEAAQTAPVRVVSYNMMNAAWLAPRKWDAILFDEVDLLQHPSSGWSENARQLVADNPDAAIIGMTGTLMPNRPPDAWNVVDTLWPGRFGNGWRSEISAAEMTAGKRGKLHVSHKFMMRYMVGNKDQYGWHFDAVNEDLTAELRERLNFFSSRITRKDIAHLLPPYQARLVEADYGKHEIEAAVAWAEDALACGSRHIFIATHYRRTVRDIAERLQQLRNRSNSDIGLYAITGDEPVEARMARLDEARAKPVSIVVATMHSVERGITLGWNEQILLAELYWRPATITQFLGRAGRVGDEAGSVFDIMAIPGTPSERIARRLVDKIEAIQATQSAGAVDTALVNALKPKDLLAILNDVSDLSDGDKWLSEVGGGTDDEELDTEVL